MYSGKADMSESVGSRSSESRALRVDLLKEPVLSRLCDALDKSNVKGWRRLGDVVSSDRRFQISSEEMELCSLKVLELEGSPSRMLLRLLRERGCTAGHLTDYLRTVGNEAALQCVKQPGLQVLIQPLSASVPRGHTLRLSCHARAPSPGVQYQWFKSREELQARCAPDLVLDSVGVRDSGFYICRVNCGEVFEFSRWAQVEVLDPGAGAGAGPPAAGGRLRVLIQPRPRQLAVGDTLRLECGALGRPLPRYQWHHNGAPLPNASRRTLTIPSAQNAHRGRYRCEVSSGNERCWTNEVDVVLGPRISVLSSGAMECSEEDFYGLGASANDFLLNSAPEELCATDKVALLMGNLSYMNHPPLKAPMVDVYDLTNLLRQLDFKVVSLLDLTEAEMRNAVDEFLLLLHKGVYGLLYYAGHGYENYGNSFMVPVDAPSPYRSAHCLCVQSVLQLMQDKQTGLNVFLLDMCRKRNIHDDHTPNILLRVTANIVFGYATCQDAEAFELSSSGLTNGVFLKFLKRRLLDDEKITVVLDKVAEDMGQFDPTKGKQALEIRSSLSERRALTDPVLPAHGVDLALAHNRQWAKAHELPEIMLLDFDCGAQIKLGFAAEFSNVLVIYTHIVKKPEDMTSCQAHVTDFSQELDVDPKEMNRETPEETGVYLLSDSLPQHSLYTRISGLQKLKEALVFTVVLQGTFSSLDEPVCWTRSVDIGKPLIARLDLHHVVRRSSCLQTCLTPHSPSRSPAHSPSRSPAHSPTRSPTLGHSPRPQHQGLQPGAPSPGRLSPHRLSPYLEGGTACCPRLLEGGAPGGTGGAPGGTGGAPGGTGVPIETTDDIEELQTVFMNSLQL
ncbi:mucosa-associated lymphoid tissue lymphoma translocation protein 1 isoform X1 [Gadus morhua]|uniref:mucosa-associated lymphoid tissue lymphoma translocation protein 1 isoform X1 n=1 Tax=Gadus morhua TaxID=8049 RepID=UPI0011B6B8EB|nr:mucosa-associated lymphoid tissue lymphoma translocation protein 1-like isoform X1 [Gadus morhua]XP_030225398.1 mucosa-associated lymphoid tissue lymphoma translocation protein 1-like isoform X1 [Gadus morhua]